MKNLILLLVVVSEVAIAQVSKLTDIFEDIVPIWSHLAFDSTSIRGSYNGMNHLSGFSGYGPKIINGFAYTIYNDASDFDQGALLEKINLQNGSKVWMNNINLNKNSKRENVRNYFINEKDELVLLNFRSIEDQVFVVWTDSKVCVRKYDIASGNLLDFQFSEAQDSSSPVIVGSSDARLFPFNVVEYEYIGHLRDQSDYIIYRNLFNENRMPILDEEIRIPHKYPNSYPELSYPYNGNRDTMLFLRFSSKTDPIFPGDSMELKIDFFDNHFQYISSNDIANKITVASQYYLQKAENGYIYITGFGFENGNIEPITERISIFDLHGNLKEELTLPKEYKSSPRASNCLKLRNQEGSLVVRSVFTDHNKTNSKIQFFISDGHGNLSLAKEIPLKLQQTLYSNDLYQTPEGDIILFGDYKGIAGLGYTYLTGRTVISKFSKESIGIITNNGEFYKEPEMSIFPNPIYDNVIINYKGVDVNNIYIQDMYGNILLNQKADNTDKLTIKNLNSIANGVYLIVGLGRKYEILFRKEVLVFH